MLLRLSQEQRQSAAHGETVAILGRRRWRLESEGEKETPKTKVVSNTVDSVIGYPDGESRQHCEGAE